MENRKAGLKVFGIVAAIFVVVLAMSLRCGMMWVRNI